MTFRAPRPFVRPPPHEDHPRAGTVPGGILIMEITTPDGSASVPTLNEWALRAWPVARLGDATLEAQARSPHLDTEDLRKALNRAGYRILGPVRTRQSGTTEDGRADEWRETPG